MESEIPMERQDNVNPVPEEIQQIEKPEPVDEFKADDLSTEPKKPKEFRLSVEEMQLCMANLEKDEDIVLYLRVVAGQRKHKLLMDYIKAMNPKKE